MDYLFDNLDKIKRKLKDKNLFLFLDFDGTIAPIAKTPDKAKLSKETRKLLEALSGSPGRRLIFISGRSLSDIKKQVGIKGAIYSGNHGLEIEGPGIKFRFLLSPQYRSILKKIKIGLKQKIATLKGAFVEDKGLTLSLHYRLLNKRQVPCLEKIFEETVARYLAMDKIKVNTGKMVLEVRPPVAWDKGKVALWLLGRQKFISSKKSALPIYIGDDVTDEDAFKALMKKGLTLFVGKGKNSLAQYYLKGPDEVGHFLEIILGNQAWKI